MTDFSSLFTRHLVTSQLPRQLQRQSQRADLDKTDRSTAAARVTTVPNLPEGAHQYRGDDERLVG